MRSSKRSRNRGGFTLTELMITVAIIGVLAAIAIPNFLTYQARARRSEAYTNLASLARAYKAYHAEQGDFPDMKDTTAATTGVEPTLPDWTEHALPALGTVKIPWDAETQAFFNIVGFQSEGAVFYSYDVRSTNCSCTQCFTATAHGNVDGDGGYGALMFVHPQRDATGNFLGNCQSRVGDYDAPLRPGTLDAVYDEVAVYLGNVDDY